MFDVSTDDYRTCIENYLSSVAEHFGREAAEYILAKYGANDLDALPPSQLAELFNELDYMATELAEDVD